MSESNQPETYVLTDEEKKARDRRNFVLGALLFGFVGLIMLVTVVRLSMNVAAQGGL